MPAASSPAASIGAAADGRRLQAFLAARVSLRYDDTNPAKEEEEYVKSIEADVRWLGYNPSNIIWASDYFETMYELLAKQYELARLDDVVLD